LSRQSKPTTINKGQYLYCPRREPIHRAVIGGALTRDGSGKKTDAFRYGLQKRD